MKANFFKLFIIFYIIGFFAINAQESLLMKRVALSEQTIKIKDLLKKLEDELGLTFSYSNDIIELNKEVKITSEDKSLIDVLKFVFSSDAYRFKIQNKKILIYKRLNKHTVSGYIREKETGEFLSDVSFYIPSLSKGVTTNTYGFYSISLPQGKYDLLISLIGYENQSIPIALNKDTELEILLSPVVEYLDEVVVNVPGKEGVSDITQMSYEEVEDSYFQDIPNVLGEKDVIKTLQLLPGVQSGNDGSAGFYVRGGAPDQNLIILDEAIVYNSNHLFGFFSIFNGDAIKSVDLYKGGFPARYGGRLSSVIEINTKDGNKEELHGKINIGLISSSFMLEGPLKKERTSFILSGRRTYADLLSLPFQTSDFKILYHFSDINFKIHHIIDSKNKLFWSNYYGKDKFRNEYEGNESNGDYRGLISWGNITSTLRWNHEFSNKLFANTSLIFSNYVFKSYIDENYQGELSYLDLRTGINDYGFRLDFDYYPDPDHSIKFGTASIYHDFTPKQIEYVEFGNDINKSKQKIKSVESAIYIEDDWKISEKLSLYPGLRLSHFQFESSGYFKPELRLASAYKLNSSTALKASYVKMNQFIHRLSNTGLGLPTDLWVSSTDEFRPQSSQQIAVGFSKDLDHKKYALTTEVYYKKMNDLIGYREGVGYINITELENSEEVDYTQDLTTGEGWAYGAEFLLRKKTGPLTGWLGYTLSWSERLFPELNSGKKFRDRYDRRHDISLVGVYKASEKITLSGSWVFSSGINYNVAQTIGVNPDSNFPNAFFFQDTYEFSTEKNSFKGEDHHRLNLGIQFHKKRKNRERIWGLFFQNVYARKNPFYYYIGESDVDYEEQTLRKVSIFQFFPSFNYSLKF